MQLYDDDDGEEEDAGIELKSEFLLLIDDENW
jgi:hypothetical protein